MIVVPRAGQSRKAEIRNSFPAELQANVPSPMNANGDSGGPVWFSTGTAVGIGHAAWGDRHLLFTDVAAIYERGTGLQIGISN